MSAIIDSTPLAPLHNFRVVLCQTSHPGNIGSTARAMKTMGLTQLVLIAPRRFPDPEATALAEIDVREAALRAGQRRSRGSGRQGVGQLEDRRVGRPALLGASLAEMDLRDLAMDDLGEVDRGGLLAERTLDRLGHLPSEKGKEANWQGQAGSGI